MARPLYSSQLLLEGTLNGEVELEVPSGYVWVVRDIVMRANNGAVGDFGTVLIQAVNLFVYRVPDTEVDHQGGHWTGRAVAIAGQNLAAYGGGAGTWAVLVSGYILSV